MLATVNNMERKSAAVREREAVEAAQHIIEREGISAVSVRNVAKEAEMSVGSLRHIFPQHDDLMVAILAHVVADAGRRVQELSKKAEEQQWETKRFALSLLMELLPLTPETRTEFQAQLAIILASPDNPAVDEVRQKASRGVKAVCERAVRMVEVGVDKKQEEVERKALRLRLLLDGLALNILEGSRWTRKGVEEVLHRELYGAGHIAG